MGEKYAVIFEQQTDFIARQHMFFVATAAKNGRVNVSPKGMESLRVLSSNRVVWLNVTGSGNETTSHLQSNDRMTIMFCAFEGSPLILRLYGQARMVLPTDEQWQTLYNLFEPLPGARQIFDVSIDLVQTSCGFGVPLYDFVGDRPTLNKWAEKKGEQGIQDYWQKKNAISLDGDTIPIANQKQ